MGVGPRWKYAEREDFEWAVEQLLIREHSEASVVRIPDDRGGDKGIDILVDYPARRIVYQLKFYTDGLSSNETTRKSQIKGSFDSAMKLTPRPDEWVLVIPCKYKDSIVTYVTDKLVAKVQGAKPEFAMIDQPALDAKLLDNPDLLDMFSRDSHFESLVKIHRAEESVLDGGVTDLSSRLRGLDRVVASQDEHWTLDYSSYQGTTIVSPRAKHPRAAEISPLGVRFGIDIAEADDTLTGSIRDALDFGAPGEVVLPANVIKDFTWFGPEFMSPAGELSEVHIGEAPGIQHLEGKAVRLSTYDGAGLETAAQEGTITRCARGLNGYAITAGFHRSLRITMLVPFAPGDTGSSSITLDTTGCEPREVHRGIGLRQAIRQAETIHIHLDGKKLSTLRIDEYPDEIDDSELRTTADIARDLDIVQDRTGSIFAMPTEISGLERIWLRILRIILDGGIAPIPRTTLNGHTHPGGEINPELCASLAVFHNATVQLFDRPLQLRAPLAYFHPKTSIQALGARDSAGSIPFQTAGADNTVFLAYLGNVVKTTTEITPWGLSGIDEPPVPKLNPKSEAPTHTRQSQP
jgi:hypothetical protein